MNIIFCGLPTSGKTSVGKNIAKMKNLPFIDIDWLIEANYFIRTGDPLSCRQICLSKGESFFRELENEQISFLDRLTSSVISLGGGSLCDAKNCSMIKRLGNLIYLKTSPEVLWKRIEKRNPLSYLDQGNPKADFYRVAQSRSLLFEELADVVINTEGMDLEQVTIEVLKYGK